jgi:hypothetical protein
MLLLHAVDEFRFRLLSGDLLGTILWRELDTAKAVTHDQATMPFHYQIQVRVHGLNRITKKLCNDNTNKYGITGWDFFSN